MTCLFLAALCEALIELEAFMSAISIVLHACDWHTVWPAPGLHAWRHGGLALKLRFARGFIVKLAQNVSDWRDADRWRTSKSSS